MQNTSISKYIEAVAKLKVHPVLPGEIATGSLG
jgi:hypothetical protein